MTCQVPSAHVLPSPTHTSYRTTTVPAQDLGVLQVAISLGGGTITASRPGPAGGVAVAYGLLRGRSPSEGRPSLSQ